jgi:hypothetical protein
MYYCPFCGQPAGHNSWWTQEQLEYAEGVFAPAGIRHMEEELARIFKALNSTHIKFEMTGHLEAPNEPMPMVEPDDMVIIVSPCHSFEPVKVPEGDTGPFHCLVCGTAFAL